MFNKNKIILFTNLDAAQKNVIDASFNNNIVSVCGAAGTGKTTLITHLSTYFADSSKLYLANTNPAVDLIPDLT